MSILLLMGAILLGLIMIPFGMPGTLIIFAATLCYRLLVPGGGIGTTTVVIIGLLMAVAEGLEWILASRFTRRYGGSRRAGWGAIIGGMIGAFLGFPVPVVGPIIGAFLGSFAGAFVFELSGGSQASHSTRVAWGALIGRLTGAAVKAAIGFAMAVLVVFAVLR